MATVAAGSSKPSYVPPHMRGKHNQGPRRDRVKGSPADQDASATPLPATESPKPKHHRPGIKASRWATKTDTQNVQTGQNFESKPEKEEMLKWTEDKRVDTPHNSPPPPEVSNDMAEQANSSSPTKAGWSVPQETSATSVTAIEKPTDDKPTDNHGNRGWNRNRGGNEGTNGQPKQQWPKKMTMREAMKLARKSPPQTEKRVISPDSNAWGSPDTEGHLRKVPSHEDPYTAVNRMVDWEGNLLPPPVEWVERTRFVDPRFYETITTWVMSSSNMKEVMDISKEKEPTFQSVVLLFFGVTEIIY